MSKSSMNSGSLHGIDQKESKSPLKTAKMFNEEILEEITKEAIEESERSRSFNYYNPYLFNTHPDAVILHGYDDLKKGAELHLVVYNSLKRDLPDSINTSDDLFKVLRLLRIAPKRQQVVLVNLME